MAKWTLLSINYIIIISTVASVLHIAVTGVDIAFLKSLETKTLEACTNCSNLITVQLLKIAALTAHLLNNVVFIVAAKQKQVYWKLLVVSIITHFGLTTLHSIFSWLNIFIRLGNEQVLSNLMQFEIHPIAVFCQFMLTGLIFVAKLNWLLAFGIQNKRIVGRNKIFGVNLRILFYLHFGFITTHAILFVQNRAQIIFNERIRMKVMSKDPLIFVTTSVLLADIVLSQFWYYWDVIRAIKQNSYKHIRRFYQWSLIFIPIYQPFRVMMSIQEYDIFDQNFNQSLWMYLFANMIFPLIIALYVSLFLYYKYLKHREDGNDYKNVLLSEGPLCVKTIHRNRLKVKNTEPIGSGHSSTVFSGTIQTSSSYWSKKKERPVAIKVLSGHNNDSGMVKVISEELRNMSRAMRQCEEHPHLVGFYGACFQSSDAIISPLGSVNIIMQLCQNGSLDEYLVKIKDGLSTRGGMLPHQCTTQLFSWAEQIAKGMDFLAKQNIIHGDLAARNILLDGTLTAKISDFGMSRKLYDYQIYVSTQQTVFPWRWMAPESLDRLKFSSASDVWSYGVLLFELFSFGDSPWADKIWSSDFVGCLLAGDRLPKPIFASQFVYDQVMLDCWKIGMDDRPTFSDLVERLRSSTSGPSLLLLKSLTELRIV